MAETRRVPLTSTGLEKRALQACPSPWHQQRLCLLPTNLMGKFVKSYCVSQVTSEQTPVLQGAGTNSIMWRGLGFKKKLYGEGVMPQATVSQTVICVPFTEAHWGQGTCWMLRAFYTHEGPSPAALSLLMGHVLDMVLSVGKDTGLGARKSRIIILTAY